MFEFLSVQEKKALEVLKERLQKRFGEEFLGLSVFGSRARGEADEDSDLDVLVLMNDESTSVRGQIFDMATDLFLERGIEISPLVFSKTHFEDMKKRERLLAFEIERDAIPL